MAYSDNIKRLTLGLCSQGHSAEEVAEFLSGHSGTKDQGRVALERTAEHFNVPFTDADWQELKGSIPDPKTIRSWLSRSEEENERHRGVIVSAADEGGLDTVVAGHAQKKADQGARAELQEFIAEWEMELSLPLNYLDNEDLTIGTSGVPSIGLSGITIKWETSPDGGIVRRFSIEERGEFKDMYETMPHNRKLWRPFNECKQLGGAIIRACSELIVDIRKQSELRTGLEIETPDVRLGGPRLEPIFAWTVYADALGIYTEEWPEDSYRFSGTGTDPCEIHWRDCLLGNTRWDTKDSLVCAHRELRARYNGSAAVNEILKLKQQLESAETRLRKELEAIQQSLSAPTGGGAARR